MTIDILRPWTVSLLLDPLWGTMEQVFAYRGKSPPEDFLVFPAMLTTNPSKPSETLLLVVGHSWSSSPFLSLWPWVNPACMPPLHSWPFHGSHSPTWVPKSPRIRRASSSYPGTSDFFLLHPQSGVLWFHIAWSQPGTSVGRVQSNFPGPSSTNSSPRPIGIQTRDTF